MLFTDRIRITKVVENIIFNSPESEDTVIAKAYIENNTKVRYGNDGTPFTPSFLIMLPGNTSIFAEDEIEIVKIHGQDPVGSEAGKKKIMQTRRVGGFQVSHLEVMV